MVCVVQATLAVRRRLISITVRVDDNSTIYGAGDKFTKEHGSRDNCRENNRKDQLDDLFRDTSKATNEPKARHKWIDHVR